MLMQPPSNIFYLPGDITISGRCGVCSEIAPIRWRDAVTGAKVGNCCVNQLVFADRCLSLAFGLRHPDERDRLNPAFNR